jgi:HEAT repeat protein
MTRKEAEAAITGPVGKLSCTVTYEPVLLYALLDDLARGGMELPHLQIICTRLYESLPENGTVITLASYEKLGRVEGVLGRYLHDVLDRLPGKLESIARDVLKELVSSEATRRVLRYDVLVARIEAEQDKLDSVLGSLVDARLLRRKEEAGEVAYEMAHEYLIEEVKVWIDQADLTFKQAEELLMREVANWRVHGTLIPVDRLALLYGQRERFKGLDDETQECLLRSAVYTCVDFTDWADLTAGEAGERVLLAALQDPNIWTRRTATLYLGSIWGMPEVSLLASGSGNERCRAAEALGKLGDNRAVEPLIAALRDCDYDEDSYLPTVAAEALRDLADSRTAEPLIAALQIQDGSVRLFAVNLLGAILDPRAIEPLLVALEDEYGDVRDAAALVLGNLREPRAVEPLVALLRRKYSYMAEEALGALLSIGTMEALTAILEREAYHVDDYYFYEAAEAVGQLGDRRAVKPLIIALRDQDVNIREAAVEALVELGEPAVPQLTAALRDERRNVHQAASKALEKIGTQEALAALGASHDPEQKE